MINARVLILPPTLLMTAIATLSGQQTAATGSARPDLSPGIPAIIKMHQSGVPVDLILKTVRASESLSAPTPDDITALRRAHVPAEVIRAIVEGPEVVEEDSPTEPRIKLSPVIDVFSVKRIYVEQMPEDLDRYIRTEIPKKFKVSVLAVPTPEVADAVLVGTDDQGEPVGAVNDGRSPVPDGNEVRAVSLVDKSRNVVLWSSEAGERSLWWQALKRGDPRKAAERLMNSLKKAMGR